VLRAGAPSKEQLVDPYHPEAAENRIDVKGVTSAFDPEQASIEVRAR
jgi:hypothetical protein